MVSKKLVEYACQLASEIEASAILIYVDVAKTIEGIQDILNREMQKFIIVYRIGEILSIEKRTNLEYLRVPDVPMTRLGQIKISLLLSLSRGLIKKGDQVVLLTGIEHSQAIDTIMVLNLETESELISIADPIVFNSDIQSEVFERVLTIAAEISFEGREGRQSGAIFVIGDSEEVLRQTENLVLNPFFGHSEKQKNIMSDLMKDTLKEFSTIDGAFVISGSGTVETAGARLLATKVPMELPKGLGTRHAAAAAITNVTKSVAISISQSTGSITIFRAGHILAEIPRSVPERRFI